MRWTGSKKNQAAKIVELFKPFNDGRPYIEPFLGSAPVLAATAGFWKGLLVASDVNRFLMAYWLCVQRGRRLDRDTITKEEWAALRDRWRGGDRTWELLYVGFGTNNAPSQNNLYDASFKDNLAYQKRYVEKVRPALEKARLLNKDFLWFEPVAVHGGNLIYCDPPYANSTRESCNMPAFDYVGFWDVVRRWSKNNVVFISEREAPADFECVLEISKTTCMNFPTCKKVLRYFERVFVMKKPGPAIPDQSIFQTSGDAGDIQEAAR